MNTLESFYPYALIISNAAMLAIACLSISRLERRCRKIEEFWRSPTGTALCDPGDSDEQTKISQRLEQRVRELQQTVEVIETSRSDSEAPALERNLPIENAIRMARLGASVDELTKSCGLNIGEANLMKKLHGQPALSEANR